MDELDACLESEIHRPVNNTTANHVEPEGVLWKDCSTSPFFKFVSHAF
jgi:hypothetical protein